MDSVYNSNTENITPVALKPMMPTDLLLTLASSNAIAIAVFISEVKDACSEFITGVRELVGDASEYDECECYDSDDDDYDSDSDDDDDDDDDNELTRKIVANEFEVILCDLKKRLDVLEKAYITAKNSFNSSMSEKIKTFLQP